jgi:hypothetical protein
LTRHQDWQGGSWLTSCHADGSMSKVWEARRRALPRRSDWPTMLWQQQPGCMTSGTGLMWQTPVSTRWTVLAFSAGSALETALLD